MTAGVALLIGNAAYQDASLFPRLRTPVSDVANLQERLDALGFETLRYDNATHRDMTAALGRFAEMLEREPPHGHVFVYYAGHGVQRGGENYLVPVDAAGGGSAVLWSCVRLSEMLDGLCWRDDQHKWFAIDACRTNALPGETRDGMVGLAGESVQRYERVRQTTVLHATAPGHVAQDGGGYGSSPFCRGILDALQQPHRSVRELSLHVTGYVSRVTQDMQTPWETSCAARMTPFVSPPPTAYARTDMDRYLSTRGHLIHKIKAKDAAGRWAYYFVWVEPENEAAFRSATEGAGIVDFEEYGRVLASSYGETPTDEVRDYLKERYGFTV